MVYFIEWSPTKIALMFLVELLFAPLIMKLIDGAGMGIILFGYLVNRFEATVFSSFKYVDPIYNAISYVESFIPSIDSIFDSGPAPVPSYDFAPANLRGRHTSTGKHLALYFRKKRMSSRRNIIKHTAKPAVDQSTKVPSSDTAAGLSASPGSPSGPSPSISIWTFPYTS